MRALTISRLPVRAAAPCRPALRGSSRARPPRRPDRRCRGPDRSWRLVTRLRRHPPASMSTTNDAKKRKRPGNRGAPLDRTDGLRSLGFDHLGLAVADRDLARLLRLGDLAHEIDVQKSVLEGRTLDLDVIGKLEDALECTRSDALIEHLTVVLLVLRLFLAFDRQRVFLRFDRKLVLAKARHRHRDTIGVLAGALDIVGRIARSGLEAVEHGEEPVETDGRTIEGSKIESSHGITSLLSEMRMVRRAGPDRLLAHPRRACATLM